MGLLSLAQFDSDRRGHSGRTSDKHSSGRRGRRRECDLLALDEDAARSGTSIAMSAGRLEAAGHRSRIGRMK